MTVASFAFKSPLSELFEMHTLLSEDAAGCRDSGDWQERKYKWTKMQIFHKHSNTVNYLLTSSRGSIYTTTFLRYRNLSYSTQNLCIYGRVEVSVGSESDVTPLCGGGMSPVCHCLWKNLFCCTNVFVRLDIPVITSFFFKYWVVLWGQYMHQMRQWK